MNKNFLTPLLIILIFGLAVYFFVWPAYQETAKVNQDLSEWQAKMSVVQDGKKKLADLKNKYEILKVQEDRIMEAVPKKEDLPGLLVQLEALASQNGLILNSLSFDLGLRAKQASQAAPAGLTGETGSAAPAVLAPVPSTIETLTVKTELSGNYEALKNFLKGVENNLRLADVTAVSFSSTAADEAGKGEIGTLSVGLDFYYKK